MSGVKTELLDTVKARKQTYYGHIMRKQGSCLEKEIMQGIMPGARRRSRKTTHGLDGHHQDVNRTPREESLRMTEVRDKCGRPRIHF